MWRDTGVAMGGVGATVMVRRIWWSVGWRFRALKLMSWSTRVFWLKSGLAKILRPIAWCVWTAISALQYTYYLVMLLLGVAIISAIPALIAYSLTKDSSIGWATMGISAALLMISRFVAGYEHLRSSAPSRRGRGRFDE